jgi:hypothetical protein
MAVLNIRVHRMAALVVASLLSSTAIANAASKFVILTCNTLNHLCDKSTGVVAAALPSPVLALRPWQSLRLPPTI